MHDKSQKGANDGTWCQVKGGVFFKEKTERGEDKSYFIYFFNYILHITMIIHKQVIFNSIRIYLIFFCILFANFANVFIDHSLSICTDISTFRILL